MHLAAGPAPASNGARESAAAEPSRTMWDRTMTYVLVPFLQGAAYGVGGQIAYYFLRFCFGYSADPLPLSYQSTERGGRHMAAVAAATAAPSAPAATQPPQPSPAR